VAVLRLAGLKSSLNSEELAPRFGAFDSVGEVQEERWDALYASTLMQSPVPQLLVSLVSTIIRSSVSQTFKTARELRGVRKSSLLDCLPYVSSILITDEYIVGRERFNKDDCLSISHEGGVTSRSHKGPFRSAWEKWFCEVKNDLSYVVISLR
jgi:hypothetical protein